MAWITHRRSADSRLGWISRLSLRRFFQLIPLAVYGAPIPRILTSLGDDLNNHYMRGRISEMKPPG